MEYLYTNQREHKGYYIYKHYAFNEYSITNANEEKLFCDGRPQRFARLKDAKSFIDSWIVNEKKLEKDGYYFTKVS